MPQTPERKRTAVTGRIAACAVRGCKNETIAVLSLPGMAKPYCEFHAKEVMALIEAMTGRMPRFGFQSDQEPDFAEMELADALGADSGLDRQE